MQIPGGKTQVVDGADRLPRALGECVCRYHPGRESAWGQVLFFVILAVRRSAAGVAARTRVPRKAGGAATPEPTSSAKNKKQDLTPMCLAFDEGLWFGARSAMRPARSRLKPGLLLRLALGLPAHAGVMALAIFRLSANRPVAV